MGDTNMIRKLLLPAVAAVLLGGCMAGGYNYRSGPGDYYYGEPSVDYRYYGSPYGGYYGYPGYYRRHPGYYGGYWGWPYDPYGPHYYYRPRPQPDDDGGAGPAPRGDNDRPPPWRNLDELRRRTEDRGDGPGPAMRRVPMPHSIAPPRSSPRPRAQSRMDRLEQVLQRSRRGGESDERHPPR